LETTHQRFVSEDNLEKEMAGYASPSSMHESHQNDKTVDDKTVGLSARVSSLDG
jgi:hypothetical protein